MIKKKVNGSIMNFANMSEAQSGDNSITAFVEVSPAEAAHNVDDYIVYNHIIYQVIDDISIGDTLVVNTNIEQAVLPEGTVIYSNDEQDGGGGCAYDYEDLLNQPQINGNTLIGNKSSKQLGIQNLFTGTTTEWAQLTADQKAQYTHVCFTDDTSEGSDGDMKKSVYDSDLAVANAGGIGAFVSDSEKDIYAVMGEMGAKNLIPYPYYETTKTQNGVTFTDNGDGSVTVVTTAGGATNHSRFYLKQTTDDFCFEKGKTYVLTDKVADGGSSNYKTEVALYNGSTYIGTAFSTVNGSVEFTLPNNDTYDRVSMYITVYKNQVITTPITFKPMLRLASDTDDTYQRYAKTNKQLTDEIANKVDKVAGKGLSTNDYDDTEKGKVADNTGAIEAIVNEYGAKNLLPNNATSQTINGVAFTVNADGSITANGTATNDVYSYLIENISIPSGKEVIVTGCPSGGSVETFYMTTMNVQQQWNDAADYGDGDSTSNGVIKVSIVIRNGYTANNLTFYPMIRDARITDPTYAPYAMTNEQLTDKVNNIETLQTIYPSMLLTGSITIKRNCGVKFVVADNLILTDALLPGEFIQLCAAGTVLNPPVVTTEFPLHAASDGVNIAPVNLIMSADGSIYVKNYSSIDTLLYAYCCGAYI